MYSRSISVDYGANDVVVIYPFGHLSGICFVCKQTLEKIKICSQILCGDKKVCVSVCFGHVLVHRPMCTGVQRAFDSMCNYIYYRIHTYTHTHMGDKT